MASLRKHITMQYWLLKSEPDVFGIHDLAKKPKQVAVWDGVRNYQARNMLRDLFKKNDLAFFYHSSCEQPGIVGVVKIVKAGYPDPTQIKNDKLPWYAVDVKLVKKFPRVITLIELRAQRSLENMVVLRKGNRLSVMPVTASEWQVVHHLIGEN
jgi:predicted RNA-binding protein with PUA-like domain